MQEFDLEDGIKPVERPKLTDFCSKCRLEVPRSMKFCPRCGFDIEGFRMLDVRIPVGPPRAPAVQTLAPGLKPPMVAAAAALVIVGAFVAWWTLLRARPQPQPAAVVRPVPKGDQGYVGLGAARPVPTESAGAGDSSGNESGGHDDRPRPEPPTRSAAPALGRAPVDSRLAPPTPAFYRVVLTDGTIYETVAPPGDGVMVTLRLANGKTAVVYRSDIDLPMTRAANAPQVPTP